MRSSSQQAASPSINKRPAQAQALGLPTTATETIKQVADELSPFVPFVAALQETLPPDLRRSTGPSGSAW